jgi:hypothetical protein
VNRQQGACRRGRDNSVQGGVDQGRPAWAAEFSACYCLKIADCLSLDWSEGRRASHPRGFRASAYYLSLLPVGRFLVVEFVAFDVVAAGGIDVRDTSIRQNSDGGASEVGLLEAFKEGIRTSF